MPAAIHPQKKMPTRWPRRANQVDVRELRDPQGEYRVGAGEQGREDHEQGQRDHETTGHAQQQGRQGPQAEARPIGVLGDQERGSEGRVCHGAGDAQGVAAQGGGAAEVLALAGEKAEGDDEAEEVQQLELGGIPPDETGGKGEGGERISDPARARACALAQLQPEHGAHEGCRQQRGVEPPGQPPK